MRAHPVVSCLFVLPVLLAALASQQAEGVRGLERDRGFGRVTDAQGKPWPEAEVRLLHRPHASIADPDYADELVVTTDAKGQFKADLLVGAAYAAWAMGPVEAGGRYRITQLEPAAVARTPILLEEAEPQYAVRLRPVLHESWQGREPLRWRALEGNRRVGLGRWLEPDGEGVLTAPRWPGFYFALQGWTPDWMAYRTSFTTTASRAVMHGLQLRSGREKPTEDAVAALLSAVHEFSVPPRRVRNLPLTDAVTGAPVANAAVVLDNMPFDQPAQYSDAQGVVRAVFAHPEELPREVPYDWTILPIAHAEFSLDPSSYTAGDPPVMARQLPQGTTLTGRLLSHGTPLAGVPLLLEASVDSGDGGTWFGIDPRVVTTGRDGGFAVRGRVERFPFRLTAALTPELRASLRHGDSGGVVAPLAVLHWASAELPEEFGDVALDALRPLDLMITEPDGTPPGSIPVLLTRVGAGRDAPHDPVKVFTDRRGRVRVLVPSTEDVLVHAVTARGAAWQRLPAGAESVTLAIDPRHVVRLRVVDGQGVPRAHASVGLVAPNARGDVDREVLQAVRDMCMVHAFAHKRCRTDANGEGVIIAPMLDVFLDLSIDAPGVDARRSVPFAGPTDQPLHLVVEG